MPITDLLMSGINLMAIGMGIVFTFLLLLVFAMKGMSTLAMRVANRYGVPETTSAQSVIKGHGQDGTRGDLVAVIAAAISRYRATHG
jgi:oxaloacetate decarboxylase gamma subunit